MSMDNDKPSMIYDLEEISEIQMERSLRTGLEAAKRGCRALEKLFDQMHPAPSSSDRRLARKSRG